MIYFVPFVKAVGIKNDLKMILFQPPLLMRRRLQLRRPLMTRPRTGERLMMAVMGGTKVI